MTNTPHMARDLRIKQMLGVGIDIARERGISAVSCRAVADRIGIHPNLVFRYIGPQNKLCTQVAALAVQLGDKSIIKQARQFGFLT
jgi:AcrR family transcriptional regulator